MQANLRKSKDEASLRVTIKRVKNLEGRLGREGGSVPDRNKVREQLSSKLDNDIRDLYISYTRLMSTYTRMHK